MSQAAIERGVPTVFERLVQASAARGRNLEIGKQVQFATRAIETPNIIFLQNYLKDREIAGSSFISASARELKDDLAEPVEFLARKAAPVAAAVLVTAACASPREAQNIVINPTDPSGQAVACEPEPYAKQVGIPTPVGVGGGPKDVPPPADVVAIRFKIEHCEPITPQEIDRAREFNLEVQTAAQVEQAIQSGKIKVKTPEDFQNYFAPITQEQIAVEIAKAQEAGEVKLLLPIKKKDGNSNLELKNFKSPGLTNNKENPPQKTYFSSTAEAGDEVVAPISGSATIYHASSKELGVNKMIHLKNDFTEVVIIVKNPEARESFATSKPKTVTVGDTLLELVSPGYFPAEGPFEGLQVVMWAKKGNSWDETSVRDLVRANQGKVGRIG